MPSWAPQPRVRCAGGPHVKETPASPLSAVSPMMKQSSMDNFTPWLSFTDVIQQSNPRLASSRCSPNHSQSQTFKPEASNSKLLVRARHPVLATGGLLEVRDVSHASLGLGDSVTRGSWRITSIAFFTCFCFKSDHNPGAHPKEVSWLSTV